MVAKYRTLYDKEQEELKKENYKRYIGDIHRGDIFYFDKGFVTGVEQQGGRPGVVVSNDACNNSSEFLLVCYLTTQPKTDLPTHVPVICEQESICLCEQIHTLSKEKMQNFYCSATQEEMKEIDKALITTLGIDLNNILPENYENTIKRIEELQEILNTKEEILKVQANRIIELEKEIEILNCEKQKINKIENMPEYIKVCAERDIYMKLYYEMLNRK